jgi:riboflavin synthase
MFTGLIESIGELVDRRAASGGFRLRIASLLGPELAAGDSLAVNGVCLTVVRADAAEIQADIGPETVRVTTLGTLMPGTLVNLERPLRADSRLGGHFVQGHVDAIGWIEQLRPVSDFHWLAVGFPIELAPYIVQKGSIAIDGISLTVAGLGPNRVDVQVVPFTLEHTNVKRMQIGDRVNLECDMIGKYVVRAAQVAGLSLEPPG